MDLVTPSSIVSEGGNAPVDIEYSIFQCFAVVQRLQSCQSLDVAFEQIGQSRQRQRKSHLAKQQNQ